MKWKTFRDQLSLLILGLLTFFVVLHVYGPRPLPDIVLGFVLNNVPWVIYFYYRKDGGNAAPPGAPAQ